MNREEIIRMAVEAGGHASGFGDRWVMYAQDLERFAVLVAAEKDKEVERMRADAERLAWLDEFALSVDMVADPDNLVQVWHSTTRPPYLTTGRTLREAIDAAREAIRARDEG